MKTFYLTTAIDYVNASPHLGHAYEKICADVIARWNRIMGRKVFFLTGTDENAPKNAQAAKKLNIPVKKFVDTHYKEFEDLCAVLHISYDRFIRTTEDEHREASQHMFQLVYDKGDIYKGKYSGYYCSGCEAFLTERDLVDGKCPEHNREPEWLEEESYFFRMGAYTNRVIALLESATFVFPEKYKNEVLKRIKEEGLKDLSVSRIDLEWGIPVPFDKRHRIYVWFDALMNYLSGVGYPRGEYNKTWPADVHLIGKGINWFHSVIWPAMLFSAGIEPPKKILVHGYVNLEGKKMSKSHGAIIDPFEICEEYGADALRYFLMREIPFGDDGEFSEEALKKRLNNELANDLGNLASRALSMTEKYFNGVIPSGKNELVFEIDKVITLMEQYELTLALSEIWKFVNDTNRYVNEKKPWEGGSDRENIVYTILDSLRIIGILLYPFIPEAIEKLNMQLGVKIGTHKVLKSNLLKQKKIKKGEHLIKKVD